MREFSERPEALEPQGEDWTQNEQRMQQAQDTPMAAAGDSPPPPGDPPPPPDKLPHSDRVELEKETWRYYDPELHGHVYTRLERPNALEPEAVAALHGNDGSVRDVGRLRYALDMEDCHLRGYPQPPETYGVESALQTEVSERARAEGIHNMQVWIPAGESTNKWSSRGFREDMNDPGHWNRRL
jgi:hypothetical protein